MTKLVADVAANYVSVLFGAIPKMVSGASAAGRVAVFFGVVILYPLAFLVLAGLVCVAFFAVSAVHPFVRAGGKNPPS